MVVVPSFSFLPNAVLLRLPHIYDQVAFLGFFFFFKLFSFFMEDFSLCCLLYLFNILYVSYALF